MCAQCHPQGTLFCDPNESRCHCKATHGSIFCDVELDPCLDKPCGAEGECVSNKVDVYECACKPGFKGRHCDVKEDLCDLGLCQNGATCMLEQEITESNEKNIGYVIE
jgi:hypothetical protein